MILTCLQTVQRLADSWRNVIGSNGIAVVLAFLDDEPELQDSDEERVKFATFYLDKLRFLYRDFENEDKKVFDSEHDPSRPTIMNLIRNGRVSFAVPLSSRLLLLILMLSRALWTFLASMVLENQLLGWLVG